ncbi:MAG TPA: type II toxin-antitoxin system RelE/ParE family toxin [Acetobacteraceae bacterium]|nr:type II toxin-antitoxin system RelE/ParE family toxin [Acetobacteraceae bacterium]
MTRPAILTPRAQAELRAAVRGLDNTAARRGLNDAVDAAARRIGANPAIGVHRPRLASPRYRFWLIPRYHYLLAYTDATDPPRIVRIVHMKRDLPRVLAELLD